MIFGKKLVVTKTVWARSEISRELWLEHCLARRWMCCLQVGDPCNACYKFPGQRWRVGLTLTGAALVLSGIRVNKT